MGLKTVSLESVKLVSIWQMAKEDTSLKANFIFCFGKCIFALLVALTEISRTKLGTFL